MKQCFGVTSTIHVDADAVTSIPVVTPDTTPTRHNDGESVVVFNVGTDVTKGFGGSVCRGFIVDVDEVDEVEGTKTNLYTVVYNMTMGIRKGKKNAKQGNPLTGSRTTLRLTRSFTVDGLGRATSTRAT